MLLVLSVLVVGIFTCVPQQVWAGSATVERYGVWEDTYSYSSAVANPWEDVQVNATFTTPPGPQQRTINWKGFYYDTNIYKVRFVPAEAGPYAYRVTLSGGPDGLKTYQGSFVSAASSKSGFVRPYSKNPYRWVTEGDGKVVTGIGWNACWDTTYNVTNGTVTGPRSGKQVPIDQYFSELKQLGFTIFRFNPANCNDFQIFYLNPLSTGGNTYDVANSKYVDQLLAAARKHDVHTDFTFFKYSIGQASEDLKRAIDYMMARYGAYADIWEVANEVTESNTTDAKLADLVSYVKSKDPYKLLVSNTLPRDGEWGSPIYLTARNTHGPATFNAYGLTALLSTDSTRVPFTTGLPVFAGETQHQAIEKDANLIVKDVRYLTWTSFFGGSPIIWWRGIDPYYNGAFSPAYGVLQQDVTNLRIDQSTTAKFVAIASKVDPDVIPAQLGNGSGPCPAGYKIYGLSSRKSFLVYGFNDPNCAPSAVRRTFTVTVPFSGTASWIDPKTGNTQSTVSLSAGSKSLTTPSFSEDIALVMFSEATVPPPLTDWK